MKGTLRCGTCRFENRYSTIIKYSCFLSGGPTQENCDKYEPARTCGECGHYSEKEGECNAPIPNWVYGACNVIYAPKRNSKSSSANRCALYCTAEDFDSSTKFWESVYLIMELGNSIYADADCFKPIMIFADKLSAEMWISKQETPELYYIEEKPMYP